MKARSRLKKQTPETVVEVPLSHVSRESSSADTLLQRYFRKLPTLFFSLCGFYAVFYLLNHVPPQYIANILLPHSFFPLLILVFLAVTFAAGFVFLNSRRGFLCALTVVIALFLQLNNALNLTIVAILIVTMVSYEILATLLERS